MLRRYLRSSTSGCVVALSLFALLCAGCGGSSLSGPKGTVSGKVTHEGAPVPAGTTVMFTHVETSQAATGVIGSDGSYSLKMQGSTDVLAGPYEISVAPPVSASPDEGDLDAYAEIMEGGDTTAPPPPLSFPERFQNPDTSGLTFDVQEGANTHNIDLTDK